MQEVEQIVPLYYMKDAAAQAPGSTAARAEAAAQLPEAIKRLDDCAEAAQKLLQKGLYSQQAIQVPCHA